MRAPSEKDSLPEKSRLSAQLSTINRRAEARKPVSFLLLLAILLFTFPTAGFAQVVVPVPIFNDPVLDVFVPEPLSNVPVPEPVNLADYVKDKAAAIRLGKALFWDMSLGSDGIVACATCHHHAGVDSRSKNTLNPTKNAGAIALGDPIDTFPGIPNYQLDPGDYPFVNFIDTANRFSLKIRNVHDVVGSQGVTLSTFNATVPGQIVDDITSIPDGLFNVGGNNTRRVTGRNTPTAINAVHNLRNFHDGRAAASFNGFSPPGVHDNTGPKIYTVDALVNGGLPTKTEVFLATSSLASQAVGPPRDSTEMSGAGRTWPDIGRKMLAMQPLTQQFVDPTDSVLGPYAMAGTGLRLLADPATPLTYAEMVAAAFQPQFLDDVQLVDIDEDALTLDDIYTMTEANFSLFFGLALQVYEATLVSDDALFDKVRRGDINPDTTQPFTFNPNEKRGLEIFTNIGQNVSADIPVTFCIACHTGPVFTAASIVQVGAVPVVPPGAPPEVPEFVVERMGSAAIVALGSLVFATNPLPDQIPFPAGFVDPLNSPLNGGTITVLPSIGSTGSGVFTGAIGNALTLTGQVTTVILNPAPVVIGDPEVTVIITVSAGGDITFELDQAFLPVGTYDVMVDGILLGTIEVIPDILYDLGFYNIGVTPTLNDLGLGTNGPNPDLHQLSFSLQNILGVPEPHITAGLPVRLDPITGLPLTLPVPLPGEQALDQGAFKVPGLRNTELTGPFFHNGGKRTLCEVLDFYNRGGDFHEANILDLDPTILNLGFTEQDKIDLAAFIKALTDDRVRSKQAPFDHPQLFIPNGHVGDHLSTTATVPGISDDVMLELAAVGAAGGLAIDSVSFLGGGVGTCDREIIDVQVSASSDDAEERVSNGQISTTSPDLDMTDGGAFEHIVGIRFNGVNIPVGATITNAYVQFQVNATNAAASSLNVQGQLNVNPLTFTTANSNISSRTRTATAVPWAPVSWNAVGAAGPDQRTSNIASIVQEIIGLPGWASGNSLAVIIDGLGTHTAESFNGLPAGAPSLHVEFTTGPPPAPVVVPNVVGLLQTPATIALGNAGLMLGTVTNQTDAAPVGTVLSQNPVNPTAVPPGTPVDLVVSSGPPPPPVAVPLVVGLQQADATTAITGATLTLGTVTFQSDAAPAGEVLSSNPAAGALVAPSTPVDLVVSSGPPPPDVVVPDVVGLLQGPATTAITGAGLVVGTVTFQTNAAPAGEVLSQNPVNPNLVPPGTPVDLVVSSGLTPTMLNIRVSASSDDAEERNTTGAISTTSPDLDMTDGGAFEHIVGMRFNGVAIPVGATITNAYVQFQVNATNAAASSLNVQGQLNANPLTFTTANSNISSRTRTVAAVPWAPVSWNAVGAAGPDQRTSNIASIVQEIIGLGGWASGNSLAVIIDGLGTHTAESFNGLPAGAPVLHVEFTTGP